MREQFPPEIEAVRRTLYPVAKKARENEENKVRLVRDRLYINNVEYKQTNTTKTESMKPRKLNDYTKHSQQRTNENFSQPHTRIFKSRNIRRTNNGGPVHLDFTTPNRFSVFNARQNDNEIVSSPAGNRKQKASSPLENDQNVKKLRDNVSANMPLSPQEPMDTTTHRPVLQQLAAVVTQEPNSQHVSRDNSPVRNADESVSH